MKKTFGSWVTFVVYVLGVASLIFAIIYSALNGAGTTVASGQKDLWQIISLCIVGIVFCNIGVFCRRVLKLRFPAYMDIYIIVWMAVAFAGGETFGLYDTLMGIDKVMHFVAGSMFVIIGASLALMCIKKEHRTNPPVLLIVLFAFAFSLAAGMVWELIEFGVDSAFGANSQRWQDRASTYAFQGSGLIDTMVDMLMHVVGAIPVVIYLWFYLKRNPNGGKLLIRTRDDKVCRK